MTVHPLPPNHDHAVASDPPQERPDTASTYDSTWTEQPTEQPPDPLERVMLTNGKIYVVLAVVLIIWAGLITLIVRTDRKIDRLERRLGEDGSEE